MRRTLGGLSSILLTLALACSSTQRTNPTILRDTAGAEFAWNCTDTRCQFELAPTTPDVPSACRAVDGDWGWVSGHFFNTCYFVPLRVGYAAWEIVSTSCRPIVCVTDDDCPWADFGTTFTCQRGLCQSDAALERRDALEMCLSAQPRADWCKDDVFTIPPSGPFQEVGAHVLETCPWGVGAPCVVPSDCRQP